MSKDLYEEGWDDGFAAGDAHGRNQAFEAGFWSAILLVAGVVVGGLLVMRVM